MFRTSNPAMKEEIFQNEVLTSGEPMTMSGTMKKTGLLLALLLMSAVVGWIFGTPVLMIGSGLIGFGIGITTFFKKEWAPITAPLYSIFEGLFVGSVSLYYSLSLAKSAYANAVPLAVLGTVVAFAIMLGLYAGRIVRVTAMFKSVVIGATAAIFITYAGSWVLSIFFPAVWNMPIYGNGWIGLGFSAFVIVLASVNLLLDFDLIETGVNSRAPQYMEWFAGFALLVTLVWLYLEILRLIYKLGSRS